VCLDVPPSGFVQRVVPFRHVLFVVAAEAGHVEVQFGFLRHSYQHSQTLEIGLVGLLGGVHELGKL
jgi:hypothetical protein